MRKLFIIIFLTFIFGSILTACSRLSFVTSDSDQKQSSGSVNSTNPVAVLNVGLLASRNGTPELGLTLINNTAKTLWGRVYFRTPESVEDCLLIKELEPAKEYFYRCSQSSLYAEDYRVDVEVFADAEQDTRLDTISTTVVFNQTDLQVFEK